MIRSVAEFIRYFGMEDVVARARGAGERIC